MDTSQDKPNGKRRKAGRRVAANTDLVWKTLDGMRIGMSDSSHVLIIQEWVVRLSRVQYRVVQPLIEHYKRPVPFDELVRHAFDCDYSPAEDRRLHQQIYRIRAKIEGFGLRVWPVAQYGYVLLLDDQS
jgi:DNA-binding response OmpR family regulator